MKKLIRELMHFNTVCYLPAFMMTFIVISQAFAHKNHSRYSSLIIDPFVTHHAILEDEQRLNFFYFNNRALNNRISNGVSIELAYALSNSVGFEIFIPILSSDEGDSNFRALGDVEVQPLKLSFYRSKNMVMTGILSVDKVRNDQQKLKSEWEQQSNLVKIRNR